MIIEPLGLLAYLGIVFLAIMGILLLIFGICVVFSTRAPRERIAGIIMIFIGVALLCSLFFFLPEIRYGNLGLDTDGNWYKEGQHFLTLKKIEIVHPKGTVLIPPNGELSYDLTPEEVIHLDKGSHFPEMFKNVTIGYEGANITFKNVPEGIDPSHLKLGEASTPFFYRQN